MREKKTSYTERMNKKHRQTVILSYVALGVSLFSLLCRLATML